MVLQAKIPDIEKCLDVVATLQAKKGIGEVRLCIFHGISSFYSEVYIKVIISRFSC